MKKLYVLTALVLSASMLLAACGAPAAPAVPAGPAEGAFSVGMITDLGGVDDKSFNAYGWKGVQDAMSELGVDGKYLESKDQSDYAKNLQQYLSEDMDLIITVGFLMGVDTATTAKANPAKRFAIVDYTYPDCWPGAEEGKDCGSATDIQNVRGLAFQTDEAAFVAGYLAAGMTETGTVGTFGGIKIPTVTIFMKGFEAGIKYYNQQKGTDVKLLGWDTAADDGLFTGNFDSTDDGRSFAESLMQEGADIILPVAGPVGLGSAAVCKETGNCKIIGVDADWYETAPEFKDVILTSVLKKIDVAVYKTIKDTMEEAFTGGIAIYSMLDGGVDIAPYHDFESQVSAELKAEVEAARAGIIDGSISVDGVLGL
jgi:basic membrane protein A